MSGFSAGTLVAALALAALGPGSARLPSLEADRPAASGVSAAQQPAKRPPARSRPTPPRPAPRPRLVWPRPHEQTVHSHCQGHTFLPGARLRQLYHGTFHVHTLHGHKLYTVLQKGQIARLYATDRAGRTFHSTRQHEPARTEAAAELLTLATRIQDVPRAGFGGAICFTFLLPTRSRGLQITICFPANSVVSSGGQPAWGKDEG